jgi:hypothetical protein
MNVHGYMIDAEWDGQTLTVTGSNKAARVALRGEQHGDGPLVVSKEDLALVDFKDASMMVNGKITVTTRDGAKHQLHFRKKQAGDFRTLADALTA